MACSSSFVSISFSLLVHAILQAKHRFLNSHVSASLVKQFQQGDHNNSMFSLDRAIASDSSQCKPQPHETLLGQSFAVPQHDNAERRHNSDQFYLILQGIQSLLLSFVDPSRALLTMTLSSKP
jgi:hypothetical protein